MSARKHDFKIGERVTYRWPEPGREDDPAAYSGEIMNIYDSSDWLVVRFDNGDHEQVNASDYRRAAQSLRA